MQPREIVSLTIHAHQNEEKVPNSVNWWLIYYSLGRIHSGGNQELVPKYSELDCSVMRLSENNVRGTISIPPGYNSDCIVSYFSPHHIFIPSDSIWLMWPRLLCRDSPKKKKTKWRDNQIEYWAPLTWDLSAFTLHWNNDPEILVHPFC